jgi:hypothetical protein
LPILFFRSQYFSAIAAQVPNPKTGSSMARYSAFLGRRVEVHYRAGDILLPASGTFVADSGRSIFLEQHLTQHGQVKNFRWEIPYQYIVRLEEKKELPFPPGNAATTANAPGGNRAMAAAAADRAKSEAAVGAASASGTAAGASGEGAVILPLGRPPKAF